MLINKIWRLLILCLVAFNAFATADIQGNVTYYASHLELGGYYFTDSPHTAAVFRAFLPVINANPENLTFVDARGIIRDGGVIREGNLGLVYRHLNPLSNRTYGAYAYYDRRRSGVGFLFSQLTFGAEHWRNRLFLGSNFYLPIGARSVTQNSITSTASFNSTGTTTFNILVTTTTTGATQYALVGADAMAGYQISDGLAGFLGAYYFTSSTQNFATKPVTGPFANLRYIFYPNKNFLFGTFDRITTETQLQYDKVRGTRWYAGIRLSLAFGGKADLCGMQRHMVDQVMRDIDVVSIAHSNNSSVVQVATNANGQAMTGQVVSDTTTLNAAIGDTTIPVISVQGVLTNVNPTSAALASGQAISGGDLKFTFQGKTYIVSTSTGGELQSTSGSNNLIKVGKNNTVSDITLTMVNQPNTVTANVAIVADSTANDLGTLTIYNVTSNGGLNMTRDGASQTGIINVTDSSFQTPSTWNPPSIPKVANFAVSNGSTLRVNFQDNTVKVGGTNEVVGLHLSSASNATLNIDQVTGCTITSSDSGVNFAMIGGDINVSGDFANNTISGGKTTHPNEVGLLMFGFNAANKTLTINGAVKNNHISSTQDVFSILSFGGTTVNYNIKGGIINNTLTGTDVAGGGLSLSGASNCFINVNGVHDNTISISSATKISVSGTAAQTVVTVGAGNSGLSDANFNAAVSVTGSPTINPGP